MDLKSKPHFSCLRKGLPFFMPAGDIVAFHSGKRHLAFNTLARRESKHIQQCLPYEFYGFMDATMLPDKQKKGTRLSLLSRLIRLMSCHKITNVNDILSPLLLPRRFLVSIWGMEEARRREGRTRQIVQH